MYIYAVREKRQIFSSDSQSYSSDLKRRRKKDKKVSNRE